jgi:hypothetical protein
VTGQGTYCRVLHADLTAGSARWGYSDRALPRALRLHVASRRHGDHHYDLVRNYSIMDES